MATNFPSGLDSFTNPTATDAMDSVTVPHADQHADVNDAVEALQAKVGVDGSAVTSSLDYKVANQGLVLVKTQTIGSGVSSVTVTDAFSATFDNYRILMAPDDASSNVNLWMYFGTATSDYYSALDGHRWSNTTVTDAVTGDTKGFLGAVGTSGAGSTAVDVFNPYLSQQTFWQGQNVFASTSAGWTVTISAMVNNSTSYTSFTVFPASGTLTGGTIRVYGYNNG